MEPWVLGPSWPSCGLEMYHKSHYQCWQTGDKNAPLNFKLEVISSKSGNCYSKLLVGALQTLKGWETLR